MNAVQITGIVIGALVLTSGIMMVFESVIRGKLRILRLVSNKTCFLVSDKEWQAVLGIIPIAYRSRPILGCWCISFLVWALMRLFGVWISIYTLIRRNPILIFHEEEDGAIDADSIIYFLQQFDPDRLYLVGNTPPELDALLVAATPHGAGLAANIILRIYPNDYPDFWSSFNSVVIVNHTDYKCSLIASVFASLQSIPIFFVDSSNLDGHKTYINGKRIYVIGELDAAVSNYVSAHASSRINYTLQGIIDRYISRTKTRKIIMVNPKDLDISINTSFQPDKSADEISVLFEKGSLPAPVLAAGRHEVIIFPSEDEPDYSDYDELIEDYVNEGKISPKYLTIIGCPSAIPQSIAADPSTVWDHRLELDGRYYGSVTQDLHYVDLATGRIYGISPSDVSANIARSLFYSHLPRNKDALVLPREDYQPGIADGTAEVDLEDYYRANYWTAAVEGKFNSTTFYSGHAEIANNIDDIHDKYDEVHLVFFADHGNSTSFVGVMNTTYFEDNLIYLMCPTVIDLACSTGQYDKVGDSTKPRLFNVQSIRRGAIVQIAAVSVSYWHQMFDEMLDNMYLHKKSLGEAYRIGKNSEYDRDAPNYHSVYKGDPWYFLMGDPAFVPRYW